MRVLVTGATGFIGGAVAAYLQHAGHRVTTTGRDSVKGERLAGMGTVFVRADLADADTVGRLRGPYDVIIHAAGLSSPWGPEHAFVRANVLATQHVVDLAAAAQPARVVYLSTPSLYMGASSREHVREDDPLPTPVNTYARTKREGERIVEAARTRGVRSIILRPRAVFGPGDTTIFPRVVRALSTRKLPIIGDGTNVVDLTYVDNVVHAIDIACGTDETALDATYNITNGQPIRLWDCIDTIADAIGVPRPRVRVPRMAGLAAATVAEWVAGLTRSTTEPVLTRYGVHVLADTMTLDISRARARLGYAPIVDVHEGLRRFVASLSEVS